MSDQCIRSIEPREASLRITLAQGDVLEVRLEGYPRLVGATPEQLANWKLVDDGHGVVWPELRAPTPLGMVNVRDLLWDRRCNEALSRLKAAKFRLDQLSEDDHDVIALWRLEADINNGGFLQFFSNWADPTCTRALAVLGALGAKEMHAIVKRMRGVLERLEQLPESVPLSSIAAHLTAAESAELQRLDEAFWKYPDRLSLLATARYP